MRAAVAELPVVLRGVDVGPEDLEEPRIRDDLGVVKDPHGLDMPRLTGRDLLVGGRGLWPPLVAADDLYDPGGLLEVRLHAPEAAAGEERLGKPTRGQARVELGERRLGLGGEHLSRGRLARQKADAKRDTDGQFT